jgi:monoamine oxidase
MSRSLYARLHRRFGRRLPGAERTRILREGKERVARGLAEIPESRALEGKKVAVVGGGFAGLAAGWTASMLGAEVTVYEAQDHVGGRVKSSVDALARGRVIEEGAELVGIIHHAWLHFADRFGLGMSVITPEDDYAALGLAMPLVLNGQPVSESDLERIYDGMTDAFNRMTADAKQVDPSAPWTARNAAEWDRLTLEQWLDGVGVDPLVADAIRVQTENNNTVPLAKQSYLSQLAQVAAGGFADDGSALFWTEAENFRCESGNQQLAFALADEITRRGGRVRLNEPVDAVVVRDRGGMAVSGDGVVAYFDYVVLALPQAEYGRASIWPKLPPEAAVQVGPAVKYLSVVDGRFWITRGLAPSGMSDRFGESWEGTDNQMTVPGQETELSVFAGGTSAQEALDAYNAGGDVAGWYGPRIEQLFPGYLASRPRGTFVPWPDRPFIRSGYSCPAPGQVTTAVRFYAEVWQGRVAFAGEHTSPGFFGYMEGALESGILAALRLAVAAGTLDVSRLAGLRRPEAEAAPEPAGAAASRS